MSGGVGIPGKMNCAVEFQENKVVNLKLATLRLHGLLLKPGETFSLWQLVGKPSKRKGYREGFVFVKYCHPEMKAMESSIFEQYIRYIELDRERVPSFSEYPFNLPVIKNLHRLSFHPEVTFIIGENGSGKSTILESIAVAYGFNAEGGTKNFSFSSKATHSKLNNYIKVVKGIKKPRNGFFFRAESFYNFATNIDDLDSEHSLGPPIINSYGGKSLHEQSHGESFFALFLNKFGGNGIYILDEPEAALSPTRQMSMLSIIHDLIGEGSQFIIATHSPIIMAYPNALIYEIKEKTETVKYEETEHYQVTRAFINNTKKMLKELLE